MRWINVKKSVFHILDLVDSSPHVQMLVSVCIETADVTGGTLIVVNALETSTWSSCCGTGRGREAVGLSGCNSRHTLICVMGI